MNDRRVESSTLPQSLYAQQVVSGDQSVQHHSESNACCVCGGQNFREAMLLQETRFFIHDCTRCGTGMMSPMPTGPELASFYAAEYYGDSGRKFGALTEIFVRVIGNRQTRFLARNLSSGARVLDVGCGRGVVASPLAAAGYSVTGLEISQEAVAGIDQRVNVVLANSLAAADLPEEHFDLVVIWHVLEHVLDPAATLRAAQRVLKPGGRLVVAVPNYSSWQSQLFRSAWFHLDPPRHLYHFTSAGLKQLLQTCGLTVRKAHHFSLRQNPFGWVQSALNWLLPNHRNRLYSCLLNEPLGDNSSSTIGRSLWLITYVVGMCAVLPLAILAACCQSGGTIHYVSVKPEEPATRNVDS